MTELEKIARRIDSYRNEMVDIQIKLSSLPAISPVNGGEGEAKKAEMILDILKNIEFKDVKVIKAPDIDATSSYRPNIIALYKGENSSKTIWMMTHMDVVPPGELALWKGDPFKAYVEAGKIYGRGLEDNQQDLLASIYALKAFQQEGINPKYDVGLIFVSDEETGNKKGIEYVMKISNPFKKQDLIIVPGVGNKYGTMIDIAEKSIYWLKIKTLGKQTQGSTPEKGINSLKATAFLITELTRLYKIFSEKNSTYSPPISTFEPTKKEANVPNINTIPGSDTVYFDCRILPDYSIDEIKGTVRKWAHEIENEFGVTINLTFPQSESAPPPTSVDAPAVGALKNAIKDLRNVDAKTIGIGGGTVAAYFRRANLPAVCWCTLEDTLHAPNEFCLIKNVLDDAKIFAHIGLQTL